MIFTWHNTFALFRSVILKMNGHKIGIVSKMPTGALDTLKHPVFGESKLNLYINSL